VLDPRDRSLLLDNLRPPPGLRLDCAVGTAFSLDLMALLVAPVAFSLFEQVDEDDRPTADPYTLLAALRGNAERLAIFCQAGQIGIPPANQLLINELEDSVIEVTAPAGGVFHPKIFLLRYVDGDGSIAYRLLCLSRNLTFDRSWDVSLVLDGVLTKRRNAYTVNHPLGDFIGNLPELALREPHRRVHDIVSSLADEVRRVQFALPPDIEGLDFWPLGLGGPNWPFDDDARRMLVVSPFVTRGFLKDLDHLGRSSMLVSRMETLDRLSREDLAAFDEVRVLSDAAEPEPYSSAEAQSASSATPEHEPSADRLLSGLHAKVYVADEGWNARMWIGSANATSAALERNVEFMVELRGKRSRCGVDACLGSKGNGEGGEGFGELLARYEPRDDALAGDPELERLEALVDSARHVLATAPMQLLVIPESGERWTLVLESEGNTELPEEVSVVAWPATAKEAVASRPVDLEAVPAAAFDPVALESVTPFTAFLLRVSGSGRSAEARFTLRLPLVGAPSGRRDAILRSILATRSGLLRFLLLLLGQASGGMAAERSARVLAELADSEGPGSAVMDVPVLEVLIQALDRDPGALDHVRRLIADLERTREGRELLGDDLPAIWRPIWDAHEAVQR
jgi:hypothetical protein